MLLLKVHVRIKEWPPEGSRRKLANVRLPGSTHADDDDGLIRRRAHEIGGRRGLCPAKIDTFNVDAELRIDERLVST